MDTSSPKTPDRRADQALVYAAVLFATGLALHSADHVRRGPDVLTGEVTVLGTVSTVGALFVIGLVLTHRPSAPLVATVFGLANAVGVSAVHFLPRWSDFSDAFPGARDTDVTGFSWFVATLEVAGLVALGAAGAWAWRSSRAETHVTA